MKHFSTMTEDEIEYVCSVIPLQETVQHFKRYPKDFAKVMPGFRATSIKSHEQAGELLSRHRNRHFITMFIEKHISRWLDEIGTAIEEKVDKGDTEESALLQTLPHSFFVDNVGLYFKLTGRKYPGEIQALLGESVKAIRAVFEERAQVSSELEMKASEVGRLKSELEQLWEEHSKAERKLDERLEEIQSLKHTNAELEKEATAISSLEQTIASLKQEAQERESCIRQLESELTLAKDEMLQLENKIRGEIAEQQREKYQQEVAPRPKNPKDIGEFKEFLEYNLKDLGVPTAEDYFVLLRDHLSEILFQGKPIVINRNTGLSLMKCVSNVLVGSSIVSTLPFSSELTEETIKDFLSQEERVVCLDNFIGNYNETVLITICEKHRDKIIFLTVVDDYTLAYVPDGLMRHCHYLNLDRIEAFIRDKELEEDPSNVEEIEVPSDTTVSDGRWPSVLKEMLEEFGVRGGLAAYKKSLVLDESSLCRLLAFDILPYCKDVLRIKPFSVSERLVKYAGVNGRCPYKTLFKEWFD